MTRQSSIYLLRPAAFLFTLSILITACTANPQPTPTVEPTPSPIPGPTDTPQPTATKAPSATPAPTATPPPTETATPASAPGYETWKEYAGDWSGSWKNQTFNTTGGSEATVVVNDDGTAAITLDLGGMVFGVINPPPILLAGAYTESEATFGLQDDPTFGNISLTFTSEGQVTGMVENVLSSGGSIALTGTLTTEQMELNYALMLGSAKANGVLTLDHK